MRALAALGFIALVWGYNWVVLKIAMGRFGPFDFVALRFAISTVLVFAVLAALRRPLALAHAPEVIAIGLLQTFGNFALACWALVEGAAGKSAVLAYTMPFWVVLFAWPLLGERPSRGQWSALALAGAGMALLLGARGGPGGGVPELLAVGSGIAWALGIVIAKRLQTRERVDAFALSAWQALFGALALGLLAWAVPQRPIEWTGWAAFALAYNVVLVGAVCWALWFWVLQRLEAGVASLGTLAVPVLSVGFGFAQLGERPGALEWSGIALVVAALALSGYAASGKRAAVS